MLGAPIGGLCCSCVCCLWYRRSLGVVNWVSEEMGNRGGDGDGLWFSVPCKAAWPYGMCTACGACLASLVNDVAMKFGVSPSRMMDAIHTNMVEGVGQLRYGLAKFEGTYFVQVMRGPLRSSHCGLAWGSVLYCGTNLDLEV